MMRNCFNAFQFKDLVKISSSRISDQLIANNNFPLHWKQSNFGSSSKRYNFYWTPICLSGPRDRREIVKVLKELQNIENFGGAYFQTRVALDEMPAVTSFRKYHLSYRQTFHLDIRNSETEWFDAMKRDSKSRFKKASELLLQKNTIVRNYLSSEIIESEVLKACYKIYTQTSQRRYFHESYKFDFKDFAALVLSDLWYLSTLTHDNEILGFSIIGNTEHNLDYTFAATKPSEYDVSRALILNAFRLGKIYKMDVCLGGGITEGDALEDFKRRMGTKPVKFANIKLVGNLLLNDVGINKFMDLGHIRWPNV